MLIIEIILTAIAWKRGWRWRSLIPIGAGFGFGFLMGIAIGASGGDPEAAMGLGIIAEFLVLGSLIVLALRPPSRRAALATESAQDPETLSVHSEVHEGA